MHKKISKLLFIFIFFVLAFSNVNSVKALTDVGKSGTAYKPNYFGNYRVKVDGGGDIQGLCTSIDTNDPQNNPVKSMDAIAFFTEGYAHRSGKKISSEQAQALIHKIGVYKYYFEKKAGFDHRNYSGFISLTVWRLLEESGYSFSSSQVCRNQGGCSYRDYYDKVGGEKRFEGEYEKATKWYNDNKDFVEVKAVGWQVYSSTMQPLLEVEAKYNGEVDYSLDMACENCDSKISDNKSFVIQDTTNWEAIKNSKNISDSSCRSRVTGHFYKNDNVYCREEYHVHLPNANNKIKVQLGRYFTLNENQRNLDSIEDGAIPNFAPITVVKSRMCKGDEGSLNSFKNSSDGSFSKCGGEITINYKEDKNDGYKLNNQKLNGKLDSYSSNIEGDTLTQKAVFKYTLPSGIYQYIRIKDGYSMKNKPNDKEAYTNLGISNLPVSLRNKIGKDGRIATIDFKYSLPNESSSCSDSYSDMYKVYSDSGSDNNYLNCANTKNVDNVYKKYTEKKENNYEKIEDSACVKLYGSEGLGNSNSNVEKCIAARQTNKMGSCYKNISSGNYECIIAAVESNTKCDQKTVGRKIDDNHDYTGLVWDSSSNKCVKPCSMSGTDYYDNNGKKVSKAEYENVCCNSSNHEEMGRDYNDQINKCCPSGTSYVKNPERGVYECCSPENINYEDNTCRGKPKSCNENTAGKKIDQNHDYTDKRWGSIGNGQYTCCDKDEIEGGTCCTESNYESLGRDWNRNEGKCCPKDMTYDADIKKCVPKPEDKCASLKCNDRPCCADCRGHAFCGSGSVSKGTGYCPGKPCNKTVPSCDGISCDGDVMKQVATYRVVDPSQPFVAQSGGAARNTGENWCNDLASGNHICSGTTENEVVKDVVTDKVNVGEEKAMYTIKLDASTINSIRSYNDKNSYDDFDLKCTDDGQKCRSEFLNSTIRGAVDTTRSNCFGVGNSSFDTCGG